MPSPNPRPLIWKLDIDMVDQYKRTDCKNYDDCLDYALKMDWNQFQCNKCNAYEKGESLLINISILKSTLTDVIDEGDE